MCMHIAYLSDLIIYGVAIVNKPIEERFVFKMTLSSVSMLLKLQ